MNRRETVEEIKDRFQSRYLPVRKKVVSGNWSAVRAKKKLLGLLVSQLVITVVDNEFNLNTELQSIEKVRAEADLKAELAAFGYEIEGLK